MAISMTYEKPEKKETIFDKIEHFVFNNMEYIIVGAVGGAFIAGISVGNKSATNVIGKGLDAMNAIGFIRYFDKDGKEIFGEDAVRRAAEIAQNVRAR